MATTNQQTNQHLHNEFDKLNMNGMLFRSALLFIIIFTHGTLHMI